MGRIGKRPAGSIVIKPAWWRQAALTLFFFLISIFFSFIGYVGIVLSWAGTIFFGVVAVLSLLDQVFEWSRLRIDHNGYSLRGWFRRIDLSFDEIIGFELSEYAQRKLIVVRLRDKSSSDQPDHQKTLPFQCSFGRPVDEVFETLEKALKSDR